MSRLQNRWFSPLRLKLLLLTFILAGASINGIAWMQAYAMTHYSDSNAVKTPKPEQLSTLQKARVIFTGVRVPRPLNTRTPESVGLAYETHKIKLSNLNADQSLLSTSTEESTQAYLETWIITAENAKGIVLLFPQYGASKQSVLYPAKAFYDLGYSVMLLDPRGVGGSTGSDTTLGIREGEDVAHAVSYTEQRLARKHSTQQQTSKQSIILYGASQGAASVMRAVAHEGVKPDAVILESPFDNLLGTVRHRFTAAGIPSFPSAELMVFWGGIQQGINGFAHNPAEYAALMDCPVLLMHGRADTRVTVEDAEAIYTQLPEKKELVLFDTVGHGAFASDYPQQWAHAVNSFLP